MTDGWLVKDALDHVVDVVIDTGECGVEPTTVVDLSSGIAEIVRYGVMHRNTFLDSPRLLDRYYRLKSQSRIAFAGQMTGVEGYVESCASGFLVGVETARRLKGQAPIDFPQETAIGALGLYVSNQTVGVFQPMNINFGIIPPLDHRVKGKRNKNAELSQRSLAIIEARKEEILS